MDDWRKKANKEDVKPCPFCGSNSISACHKQIKFLGQNEFGIKKIKMQVYCKCNNCHSRGTPVTYIGYVGGSKDNDKYPWIYNDEFKLDALIKWNKRKTEF